MAFSVRNLVNQEVEIGTGIVCESYLFWGQGPQASEIIEATGDPFRDFRFDLGELEEAYLSKCFSLTSRDIQPASSICLRV